MSLILKFNRDCIRDYFASSQWCALSLNNFAVFHKSSHECLSHSLLAVTRRCALVCLRALGDVMTAAHCARGRHFAKVAE